MNKIKYNPYNINIYEIASTGARGESKYLLISDKYSMNTAISFFFYIYGYVPSNSTVFKGGWWKLGPLFN